MKTLLLLKWLLILPPKRPRRGRKPRFPRLLSAFGLTQHAFTRGFGEFGKFMTGFEEDPVFRFLLTFKCNLFDFES